MIPVGLIAAGISALGSIAANKANADYNANEASKNRDFQLDMYNRQFNDAVNFWNLQQKFNSPVNQLHRLTQAGLNPLLMYGEGGVQNVATSQPNLPTAPSGSQARASFVNPFETAQYLLLDAQREKLNAETEKVKSEIDWQEIENKFSKESYNVRLAIQHGNLEFLNVQMEKMRNDIVNSSMITSQQVQTMIQGRMYEIKRYGLDAFTRGEQLKQGWKGLELDTSRVNALWKQLSIDMQRLVNETKLTNAQVGQLQWNVMKDMSMFGEQFKQLKLETKIKRWDYHLKRIGVNEANQRYWNQAIKNYYLINTGQEQIGTYDIPRMLWQGANKPTFQDLFVVPNMGTK